MRTAYPIRHLALTGLLAMILLACSGSSGVGGLEGFTVEGRVTYTDKQYGKNGYTGMTYVKPVRYASVSLIDSSTGSTLAETITDDLGNYSLRYLNTTIPMVYIRALASADGSQGPYVEVSGAGIHAVAGADMDLPDEGVYVSDISIGISSPANGAFNILDALVSATQFVNAASNQWPPKVKAFWTETGTDGTYFCTTGCSIAPGLYILGLWFNDSDTYDDDVILHEYAHFLAESFSRDDSPGSMHTFEDPPQDLRLSWSEGWADHFTGAVKRWLKSNDPVRLSIAPGLKPEMYIDNYESGSSLWIDLETPGDAPYMYSTNEISVSKILLDVEAVMQDSVATWSAFEQMGTVARPATLDSFWDSWIAANGMANVADLNIVFADRDVFFMDDAYEADNLLDPLRAAVFNVSGAFEEQHYLYQYGADEDVDIIAFDATAGITYSVETYCVKNGVDTLLRVLEDDGVTVLVENDDRPGPNNVECIGGPFDMYAQFSSYITDFTPVISNTYYVEVSAWPTSCTAFSCDNRSRYGTYKIEIIEN